MELKKYQKRVITDLTDYLTQLHEQDTLSEAYRAFWESRQIPVGRDGIPGYQNVVDGVPHVCYKVPTGGGKTFLACASVKPIFQTLPVQRSRAVVWLVPSDAILTQTLAALKNPSHPYRQRLNADFGGRVEVYSKKELLAGQNFSPATVAEQLSVMVLSYDSFRSANKEGRKAYQANGNLAPFATAFGAPSQPIDNADETALFQVINQLNPVVIVDESHHATSTLSHEMLVNFNPAFILDLTATPMKQANVISYVDALALKNENMVKLPVIAYNRTSQNEVITDAIDLRQSLEAAAKQAYEEGGRYVRPIVLFQAQPKTGEEATTFICLRAKLVETGIPEAQIAIKTANINELKGVDLLSPECEIRFIITVNALKEGWDCPFAYVLASLANKNSQVDVEQILGRVLRQPHATKQNNQLLNMSYVLTSSNHFQSTLDNIILGLNSAGFTKRDFRVAEPTLDSLAAPNPTSSTNDAAGTNDDNETEEFLNFDAAQVATNLKQRETSTPEGQAPTTSAGAAAGLASMLEQAKQQGNNYEHEAEQAAQQGTDFVPADLEDAVDTVSMDQQFREEVAGLKLPQFFIKTPASALFSAGAEGRDLLRNEALAVDFVLADKDLVIDLSSVDEEMYRIDVTNKSEIPKAFRLSSQEQQYLREHFSKMDVDAQRHQAAGAIYERLKPINSIRDADLRNYIDRIAERFDTSDLASYAERPMAVAEKIRQKVLGLLEEHKVKTFYDDIEVNRIVLQRTYSLPPVIQPVHAVSTIGGSLYEAEEQMNNDEFELATQFTKIENIRWWHRNIERKGFCLNGPLNHYPDFIVMTRNDRVVLVELKGEHLKNDDSRRKLKLGKKWRELAGDTFRYYMVFNENVEPLEDAITTPQLLKILEEI